MNLDHLDEDERGLAGIRRLHTKHSEPGAFGPGFNCTCHGCHVHALCDEVEKAVRDVGDAYVENRQLVSAILRLRKIAGLL